VRASTAPRASGLIRIIFPICPCLAFSPRASSPSRCLERVHLCPSSSLVAREEDGAGGGSLELSAATSTLGQLMAGALLGSIPVAIVYSFS